MNGEGLVVELILVGVLILLNGFFAAAEFAIVTASRGRMNVLAEQGDRRAAAVLALKADPDRFLATVQIGVTVVATLASAIGGVAATERLEPVFAGVPALAQAAEPLAVGTVVFVIAYVSLIAGELVPKSLAIRHADVIALWMARTIRRLARVTAPAVSVLGASSRLLLRLVGGERQAGSPFLTLDDLRAMVSEASQQGVVEAADMLQGAIEFHDRAVREVMTPRTRTRCVSAAATVADAVRVAMESGHSRLPVMDASGQGVAGLIYARDAYEAALRGRSGSVEPLVRDFTLVPESRSASSVLQEMRRTRRHMAGVVDEHGAFAGVVTMEDLIEVIVGEIDDERRQSQPRVVPLPGGAIEAEGSVPVFELNEEQGLRLPESPDYVTVAGLVLARIGSIPRGGESVDVPPYQLTVTRMEGNRIARVRVERLKTR